MFKFIVNTKRLLFLSFFMHTCIKLVNLFHGKLVILYNV